MPKNIIGAGFSDFVAKQIATRQNKNKIAFKDPDTIFYQNSNTAFLRLSSGVNVGETNTSRAKDYQLFNLRFKDQPATGYGLGGNTAYGWESNTGYGFVPPPGLVSADVKSMNRGSLREANINILCHSMDQFNIIEQLYLRLGYSMLLEWGWSWYFTNPGVDDSPVSKLKQSYHNVATDTYFFNNNTNYINLLNQIQADRKNSCGNYDAMLGRVVNYSWNLERDGSYNITLTMRSVGDVIESLKTNSSLNTADQAASPDPNNTDQTLLNVNANKSTLNNILYQLSNQVAGYYLPDQVTSAYVGNLVNLAPGNTSGDNKSTPKEIVKFDFPSLKPNLDVSNVGVYNQFYIKLGKLLDIIQNFLVYYSPKQGNQAIMKFNSSRDENFCFTFPAHGSIDPTVCLVPIDNTGAPLVNPGTIPGTSGATYTYLLRQIKYEWYEISITNDDSPGNVVSVVWDPAVTPSTTQYFNQDEIDKLKAKIPAASTITKTNEIDAGGSLDLNLKYKHPDNILQILQSSPNAKTLQENYIDKWTSVESFDGKISPASVDGDLGKEYLIKNGIKDPSPEYVSEVKISRTINVQGYSGTINKTFAIYKHSAVTQKFIDPSTLVQQSTGTNASNVLLEDLKDTGFRVDGKYIGSTMDIYVNMDFIAKVLDSYIDINTNTISIYDFLNNLMSGIQNALGCVNNFVVTYDEDNNSVRIIDSTFIPNLDKLEAVKQYFEQPSTKFITHTLDTDQGSFVRDATVKTKLSNNFASMITIGAQANGNVVGENATALSKWNVGLYDRILKEKLDLNTISNAAANAQTVLLNNFTIMQYLYSRINDRSIDTATVNSSKNAVVDFFRYYVGKLNIPGIGFLPIDLELTMDGLSGIKIYEAYEADTRLLPKNYQDAIQFITTGISHRIQNNDWTTTLNSISGPKYGGKAISDPTKVNIDFNTPLAFNSKDTTDTVIGNLKTWGSLQKGYGAFTNDNLNSTGGAAFDFFDPIYNQPAKRKVILKQLFDRLQSQNFLTGQQSQIFTNPALALDTYILWFESFLKNAGLPVNLATMWFCFVWAATENTAAQFNLFASTKVYNNSTDFNTNNGYPVQNYKSLADGYTANAETIKLKQYYPALLEAFNKKIKPWDMFNYKIGQ